VLVQPKAKQTALELMRKLLRKFAFVPERLVTDDLRSYRRSIPRSRTAATRATDERALRAACNSIQARIELWNGTLSTLRERRAA
jgi:transposase-like protein